MIDVYEGSIRIHFVDEGLQNTLQYIEEVINNYFRRRDNRNLYFTVRYLKLCEERGGACGLKPTGETCRCIAAENPSVPHSFAEIKRMEKYNIFTHAENVSFTPLPRSISDLRRDNTERAELVLAGKSIIADISGSVYIDDERNGAMSHLFKKGLDIEACYEFVCR